MLSGSPLSRAFLALSLVTAFHALAAAQRIDDGEVEFNAKARPTYSLRKDLFAGKAFADPKDKRHLETIDYAAKEVVYGLIWKTQAGRPKPREVNDLVEDFDSRLVQMSK